MTSPVRSGSRRCTETAAHTVHQICVLKTKNPGACNRDRGLERLERLEMTVRSLPALAGQRDIARPDSPRKTIAFWFLWVFAVELIVVVALAVMR
jgi:hypothetical protein